MVRWVRRLALGAGRGGASGGRQGRALRGGRWALGAGRCGAGGVRGRAICGVCARKGPSGLRPLGPRSHAGKDRYFSTTTFERYRLPVAWYTKSRTPGR